MSPNDPSVLPDVHGIQALSEARTHQPHVVLWDLNRLLSAIPVIVVTGRDPDVVEQTAQEYRAVALLQESVKADAVIAILRGVLSQHA